MTLDRSATLSHFACMYLRFLHGPKCIFFSFMHSFAALLSILITVCSLSGFPTNRSGSLQTRLLYSSLPFFISNWPRNSNSIITRTESFLWLELSITSKNVFNYPKENLMSSSIWTCK
uniref:Uncharacterized protein n=1 Tax=Helianthus annuus TaxID=4232 RepID=A0A251V4U1_HELAN